MQIFLWHTAQTTEQLGRYKDAEENFGDADRSRHDDSHQELSRPSGERTKTDGI